MQLPVFSPFVLVSLVVFACCLISAAIGILLTRAKFKKRKFTKARIIIVLSFVGLIAFYFLFYTVSNIVGRNSVREMWKKVEAAGIVTKADDIIPRSPNYNWTVQKTYYGSNNLSENAVPLYEAASALLYNSNVANKRFDLILKNQTKQKTQRVIPLYNVSAYDISAWSSNNRAEAIRLSKNKDVQQAMLLFSRGAQKPYAVNLEHYTSPEIDLNTIMPQLNNYRELFRMISFVSNCYAIEGKVDKAYKLIIDGFKSIHQFRDDPILISHLVYIACTWIDLRTLNCLISRYGINSKQAQQIIKVLNKLDFNQSTKKGLNGDLILFTRPVFRKLITGDMSDVRCLLGPQYKGITDGFYLYPFAYQEYATFIESFLKNYKLYDKPYWQIQSQLDNLEKENIQFLFVENIHHALIQVRIKVARMNSLIAATKVILALHIYKNKHGNFPDKLDSLVPGILKKISVDAVSGKAYSYTKEGKSFELTGFYTGEK